MPKSYARRAATMLFILQVDIDASARACCTVRSVGVCESARACACVCAYHGCACVCVCVCVCVSVCVCFGECPHTCLHV